MQSILWPETDDSGDDDGSGDDEEGDGDFFAALVQAEAVAEDLAAAAQAVVAPGVGPGLPGRSPKRNVEFKAEARAAFVEMELRGDSSLPQAQVLARDPSAPSGGRKTCPLPLWSLIQAHGGYVEQGRFGVSRGRIVAQFKLWRVATFSIAGAPLVTPAITEGDMQDVLEQVVPSAEALMDETAAFRKLASSVNNCRGMASRVEVWTSDSCRHFWEVHRDNIIVILMDAAMNHPNTAGYVERHTHTDVVYDELSGILALDNVELAATGCDCCCEAVKGDDDCDCMDVVAVEAWDMFVGKLLAHVGAYSGGDAKAFSAPPLGAVVPIASTDALYNIAGALLCKVTKRTQFSAKGVSVEEHGSYLAFAHAHSLSQEAARAAELPVDKVIRTQYSVDSLTFVSPSLYAFFCRLELVYWFNLNLRPYVNLTADTLLRLDQFARANTGVLLAWRQCIQDIVMRHNPALRADNTPTGLSSLNAQVTDALLRSRVVFNLVASTYKNVRGKEFCSTHAQQNHNQNIARQSCTRDVLAGRIATRAAAAKDDYDRE